jgi:putative colanic acid biosynthesis acetyltransferase WcaF
MTEIKDTITGRNHHSRLTPQLSPSLVDKMRRLAWSLVEATLYRWSPVPLHGWRRFLLRAFGARVGVNAHPYPSAKIWAPWNLELERGSCIGPGVSCYSVAVIALDAGALVSQGAHLCAATHDPRDPAFPLVVGSIRIGAQAWVAADAFIGPGVHIGERAVIGARAVVMKDVQPNVIVVGNPARTVGER